MILASDFVKNWSLKNWKFGIPQNRQLKFQLNLLSWEGYLGISKPKKSLIEIPNNPQSGGWGFWIFENLEIFIPGIFWRWGFFFVGCYIPPKRSLWLWPHYLCFPRLSIWLDSVLCYFFSRTMILLKGLIDTIKNLAKTH